MGQKRYKLARGLGDFVPVSINFSELENDMDEDTIEFEPSDNGDAERLMFDNVMFEEVVVTILSNLEPREQVIFLFQLLRDSGYQIDHNSFAKIVKLSRRQYMRILDDVRFKSWLYIEGYKSRDKVAKSHKATQ